MKERSAIYLCGTPFSRKKQHKTSQNQLRNNVTQSGENVSICLYLLRKKGKNPQKQVDKFRKLKYDIGRKKGLRQ